MVDCTQTFTSVLSVSELWYIITTTIFFHWHTKKEEKKRPPHTPVLSILLTSSISLRAFAVLYSPAKKTKRQDSSLSLRLPPFVKGTMLRAGSAEIRTDLNSDSGSGAGTKSRTAEASGNKLQLFSPDTGVKSWMLLQLLLNMLSPASLKWKASSG